MPPLTGLHEIGEVPEAGRELVDARDGDAGTALVEVGPAVTANESLGFSSSAELGEKERPVSNGTVRFFPFFFWGGASLKSKSALEPHKKMGERER